MAGLKFKPVKSATAMPIVWTIASSDSGGGAGIQADLHTIHALGGHGCRVISSVTAQNSCSVQAVEPVSEALFLAQLSALADDMPAVVIKIGLIASADHMAALATFLSDYKSRHPDTTVICDPVAVASTGQGMTANDTLTVMREQLLPQVDILTPNQGELALLSGMAVSTISDTRLAMAALLNMGVKGVCAKGGHADYTGETTDAVSDSNSDMAVDLYSDGTRELALSSPRLPVARTHGTGCIFSSALATAIALDYPVEDAFVVAKAYLNQGLKACYPVGGGAGVLAHEGWPQQRSDFPEVVMPNTPLGEMLGLEGPQLAKGFSSCDTDRLGLYPVVDTVEWLEKILQQGVKTLQLRIKDKAPDQVSADIKAAIALGKRYHARLFINDYWQLAIEHGAYGVHLGQEDMLTADLAAIKQAGLKLGLSTHGYYEILRAHALRPSYIALGHIYPTVTKEMPSKPQGFQRLQRYADLMQDYPLVAIGGISIVRAPQVVATGVGSVAVVTAITRAPDHELAVAQLLQIVEGKEVEHGQ